MAQVHRVCVLQNSNNYTFEFIVRSLSGYYTLLILHESLHVLYINSQLFLYNIVSAVNFKIMLNIETMKQLNHNLGLDTFINLLDTYNAGGGGGILA